MELNAEQIKKALECCTSGRHCRECEYKDKSKDTFGCRKKCLIDALALITSQEQRIEELTEENKLLEHCEDDGEYWQSKYKNAVADTVRNMLARITEHASNGYPRKVRLDVIDQIAKELLEGK